MFSVHDLLQDGRTGAAAVKGGLKSPVSSCGSGSGSGLTFTCLQLLSEYVELSSSCDRPEPPGSVHTDTLTVYCTVKVRVPDAHRHTERLCCGEAESYLQVLFGAVRCRCFRVCLTLTRCRLRPTLYHMFHFVSVLQTLKNVETSRVNKSEPLSSQFRFSCCATSSYCVLLQRAVYEPRTRRILCDPTQEMDLMDAELTTS